MRLDVNRTSLEIEQRGSGPPLVFLHAEFSDLRSWEHPLHALPGVFRVVTYSRRHYRPNPPPPRDWDNRADQHVEDLAELMRVLRLGPATIVGVSSGGLIALHFATTHPELVSSLVVCEPDVTSLFIPYEPGPGDVLRLLLEHPVGGMSTLLSALRGVWPAQRLFDRGNYRAGVETFMKGTLGPRFFARFSPERVEQMVENAPMSAVYFSRGASSSGCALADLRRITAPALVVHGEHSASMQKMYARKVHESIARARLVTIPDAAHFVNEHNPAAFEQALARFLASAAAGDRGAAAASG